MAYISASNLHIFPASQRIANTEDNWLSEYNLSSVINQFIDPNTTGFVISKETGEGKSIEFNIRGYYFKVENAKNIVDAVDAKSSEATSTDTTYVTFGKEGDYYTATIYLSKDPHPPVLLGTDTGAKDESGQLYSLRLFDKNYQIPETSRLSVVGLAPVSGQGLTIQVKGSEIQSFTFEATSNSNNSKIKVVDGKITEFVLDDGVL